MKDVYVNFGNNSSLNTLVLIDDKKVEPTKNEFGNSIYHVQTEKESVNIKIYSYSELSSKLWYLMNILFFFISVFGIFDSRPNKSGLSLKAEYNVKLKESNNNISLKYNFPLQAGKEAISFKEDLEAEKIENTYYIDEVEVKRFKRTKTIRWLTFLGVIVLAIGIVILIV